MKIIIFDGGPRKGWNTARMCESFAAGAAEAGAEVETVRLYDLDFKGCRSCFACKVKGGASYGRCAQRDGASGLLERAAQADGLVFASPVYLWTVTPQLHALIERLVFPFISYGKGYPTLAPKRAETAMIYTMNVKEPLFEEKFINGGGGPLAAFENFIGRVFTKPERVCAFKVEIHDIVPVLRVLPLDLSNDELAFHGLGVDVYLIRRILLDDLLGALLGGLDRAVLEVARIDGNLQRIAYLNILDQRLSVIKGNLPDLVVPVLLVDDLLDGIQLTQAALNSQIGNIGSTYIAIAILFFAYSSILGNYYYGEANIRFITKRKEVIHIYRILVGGMVFFGSIASLKFVWSLADVTMALMAICNLIAIIMLGKYAFRLLDDYLTQKKNGIKSPVFSKDKMKDIEEDITCW